MTHVCFQVSTSDLQAMRWWAGERNHGIMRSHFCLATVVRLLFLKKLTTLDNAFGLLSVGPTGIVQSTSMYSIQVPVPYRIRPMLNLYGNFRKQPE